MSAMDNEAAERRLYAELWATHNLDIVEELVASDFIEHNTLLPGQGPGREGYRQSLERLFSAFPDMDSTIEDL
ncbi:MAG: ester cyclase, partial [Bacteroidota bacterium]